MPDRYGTEFGPDNEIVITIRVCIDKIRPCEVSVLNFKSQANSLYHALDLLQGKMEEARRGMQHAPQAALTDEGRRLRDRLLPRLIPLLERSSDD